MTVDDCFNSFNFHTLSLICQFLSEQPEEAVNVFGRINQRTNEVMRTQCRAMWRRFYLLLKPTSRNPRDTYDAFVRLVGAVPSIAKYKSYPSWPERKQFLDETTVRRSARGGAQQQKQNQLSSKLKWIQHALENDGVADIENCGDVEFSFSCPILAQNLRRVAFPAPASAATADDGGDDDDNNNNKRDNIVFHCDVCDRHVYPVSTKEELQAAAKGRRCVMISPDAAELLQGVGGGYNAIRTHIGLVVATDAEESFAREMLPELYLPQMDDRRGDISSVVLSRDDALFRMYGSYPAQWHFHIVRLNARNDDDESRPAQRRARTTEEEEEGKKEEEEDEGDDGSDPSGPLGKNNMPRNGGWSFLITFPGVKLALSKTTVGTPLHALKQTERVQLFPPPVPQHDGNGGGAVGGGGGVDHPTVAFARVMALISQHIIKPFEMPTRAIMGEIAEIDTVLRDGPTRPMLQRGKKSEDDKSKKDSDSSSSCVVA